MEINNIIQVKLIQFSVIYMCMKGYELCYNMEIMYLKLFFTNLYFYHTFYGKV
jgi:hypothetical protein